jgi:hypothetical protein
MTTTTLASGTIEVRVVASADDAEEPSKGAVDLTSSDLELVTDGKKVQTVGIRFRGLVVPRGAPIAHAWVQFQVDEAKTGAASLTIHGQAADNAPTFTTSSRNVSNRSKTLASVGWRPPPWPVIDVAGPDQRTPDIAAIVHEITSRPGWAPGNALVLIVTGSGVRTAEAFDGVPAAAPLLHVEFATP